MTGQTQDEPVERKGSAMLIALIQAAVDPRGPEINERRIFDLLDTASRADLCLLPELWSTGYHYDYWETAADRSTPAVLDALSRWAAVNNTTIGGSLISRTREGALANRFWWLAPDGTRCGYDKAHLFPPLREPEFLVPGATRARVSMREWQVAQSICYDLRFPEHYRRDALDGADLFAVVSAWPDPRCEALRTLARARAIENQTWLALCNRTGPGESGSTYCGGSMVVAPDGEIVCDAGRDEGIVSYRVDRQRLDSVRGSATTLSRRIQGIDFDVVP